tara:strand:- start:336 stop:1289 length:954 start_codon:yes stop_codon:yes gene_type:complete
MSGTPSESSLSQLDAVNLLLNPEAPEEVSEEVQEQTAETEVEAPDTEEMEVEAADDSQAETEVEEVDEDSDDSVEEEIDTYAVKVDGEEGEATIDELIKSYQLEKTAQKRLQDAAEQRKTLDVEKASTEQARQQYEQALNVMAQQLQQSTQPKTQEYWDGLYESDPLEYVRQRDVERDAQTRQQTVNAEQLRMKQIKLVDEQKKLLDAVPEWKDTDVQTRETAAIVNHARSRGWTDAELNEATDHRYVVMMRDAYLYNNLQSQKPIAKKKVKTAPKMVKSGQPKSKGDSATERKRKAFDSLSKSGSRDAAVNYLLTK